MGHILAYYWKHWSASTIGLTVNTLAVNGDVLHEWEEEQRGLRRIIPFDTNAIFSLMLWCRRTLQRGLGVCPATSVCWGQCW